MSVAGAHSPNEAHRSQYDFIDGHARHMRDALPHASFIGYPPDKQEKATQTVLEQAELLSAGWAEG